MPTLDYKDGSRNPTDEPRYSPWAVAAAVMGAIAVPLNCGFLFLTVPMDVRSPLWQYVLWTGDYTLFPLAALSFGIAGIVQVHRSRGRYTGTWIAIIGIGAGLMLLLPAVAKIFHLS